MREGTNSHVPVVSNGPTKRVEALVERLRERFAPDPRLSVFDVGVVPEQGALRIFGGVSDRVALGALERGVAGLGLAVPVRNETVLLPDARLSGREHAVVSATVAPMLLFPEVCEPQVSQVVMGNRVRLLRRYQRWYQCRSQDGYPGWIHRGYLKLPATTGTGDGGGGDGHSELLISLGAGMSGKGEEPAGFLPWGALVRKGQGGAVLLPDGREVRAEGVLIPARERAALYPARGGAVAASAAWWLGAPYLWGGVTPAGVDCSGLVQALFRLHGVELPRDSDQQVECGEPVDPGPGFSALQPGDLLFFAEEPDLVITHVTISEGGSHVIHSSLGNGGVRRNDLAGDLDFERELARIFVCARRVAG
ncbi:MAG: NlpC/P60 family protein [Longimicrobiaceae bacterium]